MFYIIVGSITFIAFILLIITIHFNKFQFSIIKIEEAENNTSLFLNKKLDLIKRIIPIINELLKKKNLIDETKDNFDKYNLFELNEKTSDLYNKIFKIIDENDKLLKSDKITNIIDDFNDNEEELTASIKFYNDTVVVFNKLICSFPSNIIRLFFGYKKKDFFNHEKREIYEILKEK